MMRNDSLCAVMMAADAALADAWQDMMFSCWGKVLGRMLSRNTLTDIMQKGVYGQDKRELASCRRLAAFFSSRGESGTAHNTANGEKPYHDLQCHTTAAVWPNPGLNIDQISGKKVTTKSITRGVGVHTLLLGGATSDSSQASPQADQHYANT